MSVSVIHADSRDALREMADASVDSVVCDPPYALVSIAKRLSNATPADLEKNFVRRRISGQSGSPYAKAASGFMGKTWDTGETAFDATFWVEVLRVVKPGGHLIAFGGTRTYHRLVCAIEDSGFEIRDQLAWLFGSGFPKSHNQPGGWGTALKPAHEPICLARKPLIGTVATNLQAHGTGALNIDASRIHADDAQGGEYTVTRLKPGATLDKTGGNWRPEEGGEIYHGEMKPGRWPANVIHDGSDEVLRHFPESDGQQGDVTGAEPSALTNNCYGKFNGRPATQSRGDVGSAARFFYTAKADAEDRLGSKHPTVKPVDLMAYLVRLVTPPGGLVLDPFAGSGTTGMACMREGFRAILIEREAEYVADIKRRIAHVRGEDAPLFAEVSR